LRVLLVDDNHDAARLAPDVFILDIGLPGMATARRRARPASTTTWSSRLIPPSCSNCSSAGRPRPVDEAGHR
jgi:hypothetical protein